MCRVPPPRRATGSGPPPAASRRRLRDASRVHSTVGGAALTTGPRALRQSRLRPMSADEPPPPPPAAPPPEPTAGAPAAAPDRSGRWSMIIGGIALLVLFGIAFLRPLLSPAPAVVPRAN